MSIPRPERLLFQSLILAPAEAAQGWSAWHELVDMEHLDPGSFQLLPALSSRLTEWTVDDPRREVLKGICRRAWTQNQFAKKRFTRAVSILAAAGINRVAGMGPLLWAEKYWPAGSIRSIGRVDILVEPDSAHAALVALDKEGFNAAGADRLSLTSRDWRFRRGVQLQSPSGNLWLHWRALPNTDFSLRCPEFPPLTPALSGHPALFFIPPEYSLVTAVSRVCQDAIDWHFDAFLICRQTELDWDKVGQLIRRRSVERARLEEVRVLLGADIPQGLTKSNWTSALERPLVSALRMYRNSRATRL